MIDTVWPDSWVRRAKSALGMAPCRRMACSTVRSLNWRMPCWLEPRIWREEEAVSVFKRAFSEG